MDGFRERGNESQYLTLRVGDHTYALGLLEIREIVEHRALTPLPVSSAAVLGLLDLRGRALPVFDLAVILGLPRTGAEGSRCILVVDAVLEGRAVVAGLLVEEVCRVTSIDAADLQEAPWAGTKEHADYVQAVARVDKDFLPLLDLERVFTAPALREPAAWEQHGGGDAGPGPGAATG